jgi:hypothetical protein
VRRYVEPMAAAGTQAKCERPDQDSNLGPSD